MKLRLTHHLLAALLGAVFATELHGQTPDTTPPDLHCPRLILTPCQTTNGATVFFSVIAEDDQDTNVTVTCSPPSGATFPIGTNLVTCWAEDDATNISTCSFEVVVTGDCTPDPCLSIQCPPSILTNCTMTGGTPVTFAVEATNHCGGTVTVTCEPPSGSLFPPGISTVLCRADPLRGEPVFCSFTVEVVDEVAPVIQCPSNLVVAAQALDGTIVTWQMTASDNCDTNVTVYCDPPAGSVFPLGMTPVTCWAQDGSGNTDVCGFTVTVTNARPFGIEYDEGGAQPVIVLRWAGHGQPQEKSSLEASAGWQDVTASIITNGNERMATLPLTSGNRFFRLVAAASVSPLDGDGDGVPDSVDRCPQTPMGVAVDANGCALIDLVRDPRQITAPAMLSLEQALTEVREVSEFSAVVQSLELHVRELEDAETLIRQGQLNSGTALHSQGLSGLELESRVLEALIGQMVSNSPPQIGGDGSYGDITEEQSRFQGYDFVAGMLRDAIAETRSAGDSLGVLSNAVTGTNIFTALITRLNDAERWLQLDTGQVLGIPERDSLAQVTEGSTVNLAVLDLADGTGLVDGMSSGIGTPPVNLQPLPIKCLFLRIAPVQRFPPFSQGPFVLHSPAAYDNGSEWLLEEGMRFGVIGLCPDSFLTPSNTTISYRMKLELYYKTRKGDWPWVTLAHSLAPGNTPVPLPADLAPGNLAYLRTSILRYECTPAPGIGSLCTNIDALCVEVHLVRIEARNAYPKVEYLQTLFDLEDSPINLDSRTNKVDLVFFPNPQPGASQLDFKAEGFRVVNGQSSYPHVQLVGENQNFAIHVFDFLDPTAVARVGVFSRLGVARASGLMWPHVTGKRNGYTFSYSCDLPKIVRDVVAVCIPPTNACGTSFNTFYRLPFREEDYPLWRMGQLNCGTFTHKGNTKFAFDFIAPAGTGIRAARGGVVVDFRESRSDNCYDNTAPTNMECAGCPPNAANMIMIRHMDGSYGYYYHMPQNGVFVEKGQRVYRGDVLGIVGNTGCSSLPHLHFEARSKAAGPTIPSSFEAWSVCPHPNLPTFIRCEPIRVCYIPVKGEVPNDYLFSTNKGWWE